jgi:hypothetical protein
MVINPWATWRKQEALSQEEARSASSLLWGETPAWVTKKFLLLSVSNETQISNPVWMMFFMGAAIGKGLNEEIFQEPSQLLRFYDQMGSTQNLKCIRLPFRCQGVQLPSHVLHSW